MKPISHFESYYLYGLCKEPSQSSKDAETTSELYKKVIGLRHGLAIGAAFHPYQLVNEKGVTVWQAAYLALLAHQKADDEQKIIFLGRPQGFDDLRIWPDDRLSTDKNPIFAQYVPFIIPFFVEKTTEPIQWDLHFQEPAYLDEINNMIRFLMPAPGFVLGLDEFKEEAPSKMIDRFVTFLQRLG